MNYFNFIMNEVNWPLVSCFSITLCYLLTVFSITKIPLLTMSDKAINATVIIQLATLHSAALWMPWMRSYYVDGTGAFGFYALIVIYCVLVGFSFYNTRSGGFFFQGLLFGLAFYDRINAFQNVWDRDRFVTYVMCSSALALFGGLILFCIITFGLEEGFNIKPSRLNPKINDGQFWLIVVMMPLAALVDYWLRGLWQTGQLFNLYDYAVKK